MSTFLDRLPSKIDRLPLKVNVLTFEDRDQCEIMLLHLLKTLLLQLYVNCAEGFHFSAFINPQCACAARVIVVVMCVCMCVCVYV